jgi:hypothetical protein
MHVNRFQAFAVHLTASAIFVGLFLALTFFVLYPAPLFQVEGAKLPLQIMLGVDIVLGPLLTLVVFKPGKPGLKFDMAMIVTVQLAAFIYGASIISSERPALVSFAVDRFVVIAEAELEEMEMDKLDTEQVTLRAIGPTFVYAEMPTDKAGQDLLLEAALGGKADLERLPQFYRDFNSNIARSFDKAMDLQSYAENFEDSRDEIEAYLKHTGKSYEDIAAFPVAGKHHDMVMVVDKQSKQLAGYIDIHPWMRKPTKQVDASTP